MRTILAVFLICACATASSAQRFMHIGKLFRLQAALAVEAKKAKGYGLAPKSTLENLRVSSNFFNVALLNDSVITIKGRIDFQKFPNTLIESGKNGRVFTLTNTQFISVLWEGGEESIGVPGDSTWLFRVSSNNLNLYASVPYYVWDCVVALQKGDEGEVLALNAENLGNALSDNENAYGFFKDERIQESIDVYNGVFVDKNRRRKGMYNWPDPYR